MNQAHCHFPFLPATMPTSAENFFRTDAELNNSEDAFVEMIWRVAKWRLNVNGLVCNDGSVTVAANGCVIEPGEDVIESENPLDAPLVTNAFKWSGPGDMMANWRQTRHRANKRNADVYGPGDDVYVYTDISWGPSALWPGAELESHLSITANTDAGLFSLSNHYDATHQWDNGVFMRLMRNATPITSLIRTFTNQSSPKWSAAGYIELEMLEWFPWEIDGEATWNGYNGGQLLNPLRRPASGRRQAYVASATATAV